MIETKHSILCEVIASNQKQEKELIQIARTCAIDLKVALPLEVETRSIESDEPEAKITFSIPVKIALGYDSIWRLACRVAYFCPQIRVTTQIQS